MAAPHRQGKEIRCYGFYTYRVLPSVAGPLALLGNLSSGWERKCRHRGKLSHQRDVPTPVPENHGGGRQGPNDCHRTAMHRGAAAVGFQGAAHVLHTQLPQPPNALKSLLQGLRKWFRQ